jgi:hypothetical protein
MGVDTKTDWLTDRESQCDFDFESFEMAVKNIWEEMARKELACDKTTSRVIWSESETVINPLPGYD